VFDTYMRLPNQIGRKPEVQVTAADLLTVPQGEITEEGLARNIDVGLQYLAAWVRGNGCVPIYNLMEDAATAEICRAQVWQWVRHSARLSDGRTVTPELVEETIQRQGDRLRESIPGPALELACRTYEEMIFSSDFPEFLTLRAYDSLD
jgi:malate synthase